MIPARLLNLLLLSALALAAGRFWTFLREPPPQLPAAASAPAGQESEQAAPEETPAAPAADPAGYDVIVARDLFSPARGVVPPAPTETTARAAAPPPQPAPKLTLYGVVILDGEKSAFLQEGAQETKPRRVREGERFAGGVVSAIRPDGVTFLFAGKEIAVALRAPKEGITPAPLPPQPQPQPGAAAGGAPAVFPRQFTPPAVRQPAGRVPQPIPGRVQPPVPQIPPGGEDDEDLGDEEYFEEDGGEEFDEDDLEDDGEEDLEE